MAASRHVLALCLLACRAGLAIEIEFDSALFQKNVPQAQSRQELDAYLDVVQASSPVQLVAAAAQFREKFASSEFSSHVYRMEMLAHADLNDRPKVIAAGERALALNPHDVQTLLTLARAIAGAGENTSERQPGLASAEAYARNALKEIDTLKAPRSLSLDAWERMCNRMRSSAHESLGVIAFDRGKFSESVAEFQQSTRLNTVPDGGQFYRLGIAYAAARNRMEALAAFQKAEALGPDPVRTKARKQLSALGQTSQ
jgi:tetratricopeptide (TPR) repeat protein